MADIDIEEFAGILIEQVRDLAIQSNGRTLLQRNNVISDRWKKAMTSGSAEEFAKVLISDVVDSTISHFLRAIDQGLLPLSFTGSTGDSVDLTSIATNFGEMEGSFNAFWRQQYSKEPVIDDFADLRGFFDKTPEANQEQ